MAAAQPTSMTIDQVRQTRGEWKFSRKEQYGPTEYKCKATFIRYNGKKIEVQLGASPLDFPDSPELLTSDWGISVYLSKEDREKLKQEKEAARKKQEEERSAPPGAEDNAWGGSASTIGGFPSGADEEEEEHKQSEEDESEAEKKAKAKKAGIAEDGKPARRTLEINLQPGSDTKKLLEELDDFMRREVAKRSTEWMEEEASYDIVKMLYRSSVRKPDEGKLPSLSTKVNVNYLTTFICDEKRVIKKCHFSKLRKNMNFVVNVELTGIWFTRSKDRAVAALGPIWNTKSIILFPSDNYRPAYNFQPLGSNYVLAVDEDNEEDVSQESGKRSRDDEKSSQESGKRRRVGVMPGDSIESPSASCPNPAYDDI